MAKVLVCCVIGCDEPAKWELRDGPTIDDSTHACTKHVGVLLVDGKETTVTPIERDE